MYSKKEVLGVRCEILSSVELEDEKEILIGGNSFFVKKRNLSILSPVEKFAAIGESPFFLRMNGIIDFIGPRWCGRYLVSINSRGYRREALVPERDLVLLDGKLAA